MSMNVRDKKAYRADEKSDGFLTARQRRQIFYVRRNPLGRSLGCAMAAS